MTLLHRIRWRLSARYRLREVVRALEDLERADIVKASVGLDGERRYRPADQ